MPRRYVHGGHPMILEMFKNVPGLGRGCLKFTSFLGPNLHVTGSDRFPMGCRDTIGAGKCVFFFSRGGDFETPPSNSGTIGAPPYRWTAHHGAHQPWEVPWNQEGELTHPAQFPKTRKCCELVGTSFQTTTWGGVGHAIIQYVVYHLYSRKATNTSWVVFGSC